MYYLLLPLGIKGLNSKSPLYILDSVSNDFTRLFTFLALTKKDKMSDSEDFKVIQMGTKKRCRAYLVTLQPSRSKTVPN